MPQRRPGIKKNYNLDCKPHLTFLVEGLDSTSNYKEIDNFEDMDHLEAVWEEHRGYLLNLFFHGDEQGSLGGYAAGHRPAGWWWAESPIKDLVREEEAGVVGDKIFINSKYAGQFDEYILDRDHFERHDYNQFILNQPLYLQDNDLLFKWERSEIQQNEGCCK